MNYSDFLETKRITIQPSGFSADSFNPNSFMFQKDITRWALERGKAAIFSDCGTGKSLMELDWADHVVQKYDKPVLIIAPLAVSKQTVREGQKFGIQAYLAAQQSDVTKPAIYVTNYEKLHHFDPSVFPGVVPDESSILKSYSGATRNLLVNMFAHTPMKLCATATPAPNDQMENGNHAEFLGILTRTEMLSTFFVHDGGDTSKWRLKGHAEEEYWKWICQWAVMLRQPSDLGYENKAFVLPPLHYHHHVVKSERNLDGFLFPVEAQTLLERRGARRNSLSERVELCASLVNGSTEPWLVWCDLNAEGDALTKLIPGAVQVAGRDRDEDKEDRLLGFAEGRYRVLVSKPSIAGHGLNLQACSNMAFVGLSDSWEQWYQAVRRCWRFGQKNEVNCHVITSEAEGAVVRNIRRKEADAARMAKEMVKHMSVYNTEAVHTGTVRTADTYKTATAKGERWEMRLGDCIELIKDVPTDSVHYSIQSPPFASLYCYSASERDLGNSRTHAEFYEHFSFLVEELYRVLMPGRLLSFHCMNLPTSKERDGVIGISDFRGDLIRMFCGSEAATLHEAKRILQRLERNTSEIDAALLDASLRSGGFIYHSEVVIWKDPVTAMQRTKALGLLHKQLVKDSCMSRQGIPDYLVTMRKPGENPERVAGPLTYYAGDAAIDNSKWNPELPRPSDETRNSINIWQHYASPVWRDINPSDTLQRESAREQADERHVCPLQLQVIERGIQLWTNPGDLVYSPFAGIGSEGYRAVQMGRRFLGHELKESYFKQACANLRNAESAMEQTTLFSGVAG
jgi:hypothetical protein